MMHGSMNIKWISSVRTVNGYDFGTTAYKGNFA